ncbi:tetratricopeptide repeat protein [Jannaschia sp. S6380]|uniref:tetratricopeptide repeat protein n=1 Tax=Jannaschia sp. S6380 TaxID=2926408 RepID=UPI001FF1D02E|nr:tetratricopeptide repeat protein [Jannaschia sp. S6380]
MALAGCAGDVAERGLVADDPLAAPGSAGGTDLVDPLIVGDRLLDAGEPELALASYLRAAGGTEGMTPTVMHAMARANIAMGRLHQAERLLRDVVEAEPRNARALNNLGVVLLELDRTGEAHRVFRTAFALQPSPEIRDNLRVSGAKMENAIYPEPADDAFTLTRRTNGSYGLHAPEQFP